MTDTNDASRHGHIERTASRRTVFKAAATAAGMATIGQVSTTTAAAAPTSRPTTASAGASPTPFGNPTAEHPSPGADITAVRGDRATNWPAQTRSEVLARNGVVATSQPLAAQAGLSILQNGGNAVDAAVATAAALAVVEPVSTSLGGDAFAIVHSARDGRLHGLNASGWCPKTWNVDYFHARGYGSMPLYGPDTVSVPGAVDGFHQLLQRFGTRGFDDVLAPAVQLAEDGFGVTERIHGQWRETSDRLREDPDTARVFLVDDNEPALYSAFRNPELANALRVLQREGRDAFYRGRIADAVVSKINDAGGQMDKSDLVEFASEWVDPLTVPYRGHEIAELPPNTQGFAALVMLRILAQCPRVHGLELADLGPRHPQFWHLLVEAKKRAYDELYRYNGDPRFTDVPLDRLLSERHARQLCRQIDPNRAQPPQVPSPSRGGTVYLCTADRWGNMVSFIFSSYEHFGSGLTVPGYGFPLQNRAALFTLNPSSPNVVQPRKRPFHTLIPGFLTRDGEPVLSFGNMGGDAQPQAQATEVVNMIDLGMNPQAAVDAARFSHDHDEDVVQLESQLHALVGDGLAAMGHRAEPSSGDPMGGYQAVHVSGSGDDRVYRAASDHRKDGQAVGW